MTHSATDRRNILRGVWWLHPQVIFTLVVAGTMLVAVLSPESFYAEINAQKFVNWTHFGLALVAVGAFVLGCRFGLGFDPGSPDTDLIDRSRLRTWFWIALGLTAAGYVIWTLLAVRHGLSLGLVKQFLFGADEQVFIDLKRQVFVRIPGITTATQFAVSAGLLGILVWYRGDRWVSWTLAGLSVVVFVRAVLYSERLAFIEFGLAAFVLAFRLMFLGKPMSPFYRTLWQAAPIGGVISLVLMFGTLEYLRSWKTHQRKHNSVVEFTLQRISAYYNTSNNNSALLLEKGYHYPIPYGTLQFFWQFPLVKLSPLEYEAQTGMHPEAEYTRLLELHVNEEFNNDGGLFQPIFDYGLIGLPLFWGVMGALSGYLYRSFLAGRLTGLVFYPILTVSLLETPRVLYLTNQRIFPALALLFAFVWFERHQLAAVLQRRRQPAEAGGLPSTAEAGR